MDVNVIDAMDLEDLEFIGPLRRPIKQRRRMEPLEELSDEDFRYKYRFSKDFAKRIVDIIKDDLSHDPRGHPISPEIQVVCALRSWARHEIQDDTADLHGVSQPAVSNICKKVAEALAWKAHRFIKMPTTLQHQEEVMRKFCNIAGFPTVTGAIDCTHIRVKKIGADDGQLYINRKGFPSINVQVVCDADLKIMDIVTRWRGSVHDSRIFRKCRLKQRFEAGAFKGILLGDYGYPCTPYLYTPVLNPSLQEERYNRSHIRTRYPVERCLGLWKQRFRCLLRGMFGSIETAKKTIVAFAVLHNIAIEMKEGVFPVIDDNSELLSPSEDGRPLFNVTDTVRGKVRRRQFIKTHF